MPKLFPHLEHFKEAFDLLSMSRAFTFGGQGPIPLSEMITYMNWRGIQGIDEQVRFIRYMKAMDNEYMTITNHKEETK
jgi:hypothetical protein